MVAAEQLQRAKPQRRPESGSGPDVKPGEKELPYLAQILGGAIHVVYRENPQSDIPPFGSGPLAMRVRIYAVGEGAEEEFHFELEQTWISETKESGPAREGAGGDLLTKHPDAGESQSIPQLEKGDSVLIMKHRWLTTKEKPSSQPSARRTSTSPEP